MKPTVCVFNTFAPVVPLLPDLSRHLAARGVALRAVLSAGRYRGDEAPDVPVARTWLPRILAVDKRLFALFYWITAPLHVIFGRSDLNIFLTQPPLFFVLGGLLSRLRRVPYLVHVMDQHPHLLVAAGLLRERGLAARILRRFVAASYRRAARVVVIGRCMAETVQAQGVRVARTLLVPNWAAPGLHPTPVTGNAFRERHGWQERFVVMYSGNMGTPHVLSSVLAVAREFERTCPRALFVFVGHGRRQRDVKTALQAGAGNVVLLPVQPASTLRESLGAADVHVMSLRAGFEGHVVPSKFYGALATGRPVVYEGRETGEVARCIHEAGCGCVVDVGDTSALAAALHRYAAHPELADEDGRRGRAWYDRFGSAELRAGAYADEVVLVLQTTRGDA